MTTPLLLKVVCLYDVWEYEGLFWKLLNRIFGYHKADPLEGHVYTVIEQDRCYYKLKEFPYDLYRMEGFAPVADYMEEISFEKIIEKELTSRN